MKKPDLLLQLSFIVQPMGQKAFSVLFLNFQDILMSIYFYVFTCFPNTVSLLSESSM